MNSMLGFVFLDHVAVISKFVFFVRMEVWNYQESNVKSPKGIHECESETRLFTSTIFELIMESPISFLIFIILLQFLVLMNTTATL